MCACECVCVHVCACVCVCVSTVWCGYGPKVLSERMLWAADVDSNWHWAKLTFSRACVTSGSSLV